MAGTTGLEPATSAVTGQRSNQLNYVPFQNVQTEPSEEVCSNEGSQWCHSRVRQ
jgi:hypothetical protein